MPPDQYPGGPIQRYPCVRSRRLRLTADLAAGLVLAAAIVAGAVALPHPPAGAVRGAPAERVASETAGAATVLVPAASIPPAAAPTPAATPAPVALPLIQPENHQPCTGWVQPVGGGTVWLSTGYSLLISSDQGASWHDVSPPGANLPTTGSFCALDAGHAWVVSVTAVGVDGASGPVGVWRTSDGGHSWTLIATTANPMQDYPNTVQFVDAEHGWLMLGVVGNAHRALLLGTDDGGVTWSQRSVLYDGVLDFVTPLDGWLASMGGAAGGLGLYHTIDGGRTWVATAQSFLVPVDNGWCMALDGFRFVSPNIGVAASDSWGCGKPGGFGIWVTHDGGLSWHEATSWPSSHSCGLDVLTGSAWVLLGCTSAAGSPAEAKWTFDAGATWVTVPLGGGPGQEPAAALIAAPTLIDSHDAIGMAANGSEPGVVIYRSDDAGETWQGVTVPGA